MTRSSSKLELPGVGEVGVAFIGVGKGRVVVDLLGDRGRAEQRTKANDGRVMSAKVSDGEWSVHGRVE